MRNYLLKPMHFRFRFISTFKNNIIKSSISSKMRHINTIFRLIFDFYMRCFSVVQDFPVYSPVCWRFGMIFENKNDKLYNKHDF